MFYINDIESPDRYGLSKLLEYNKVGDYNTLSSIFVQELRNLPLKSYITSKAERPDLLSYNIYGDTQFAWVLMVYNNCFDFTDGTFSAGAQVKYPSIENLEKVIFTLKARQRAEMAEQGTL